VLLEGHHLEPESTTARVSVGRLTTPLADSSFRNAWDSYQPKNAANPPNH
jgi:hypothetical protein